jgi:hypothetical protein
MTLADAMRALSQIAAELDQDACPRLDAAAQIIRRTIAALKGLQ